MSTPLPTLVSSPLPDVHHTRARGGFSWWYIDLIDHEGNGIIAIIALGLPFLPGYASSARAGVAPEAAERPSICFTALSAGRPIFWALHELEPSDLEWTPDRVRIGRSEVSISCSGGVVRAVVHLEGELPRCPWQADITVEGPLRRPMSTEPAGAPHEWTVLAATAEGKAVLTAAQQTTSFVGRAYLDRNAGDRSLEAFQIAQWSWGRLAFSSGARVWYQAKSEHGEIQSMSLDIDPRGETQLTLDSVRTEGHRRGLWGLAYPHTIRVDTDLALSLSSPIDDSPFYARFVVTGVCSGERGYGFAETCRPACIDSAWFRPLLRMTVCHDGRSEENSMWLPLFGGPRKGRLSRLVGWAS